MDTRDAGHGAPEVLEVGRDPKPPRLTLAVTVGALCLGLGTALGASLFREEPAAVPSDRVLLSVGGIMENPDLFGSSRYLLPVHNLGAHPVTVEQVAVAEADAPFVHVDIAPGGWQAVPFTASPLCDAVGIDPRLVVVRGTVDGRAFEDEVPAYQSLDVVMRDQALRCFRAIGHAPTAEELEGTWVVRDGEYLPGTILVHFLAAGRLVLDDSTKTGVFGSDHVLGTWGVAGSHVEVVLDAGIHCSLGTRWDWKVTLQDRRLYLRRPDPAASACRQDLDRAWVAERVDP